MYSMRSATPYRAPMNIVQGDGRMFLVWYFVYGVESLSP